jgi:hypothetical protein
MMDESPTIINLHKEAKLLHEYGTLYIGRSERIPYHFGNPFSHLKNSRSAIVVKTREDAINEFEKWLLGISHKNLDQDRRHWIIKHLWKIKQAKRLACFCAPAKCHGDILKKTALEHNPKIH